MKATMLVWLFLLSVTVTAYCQQSSRIDLTDGSVIYGQVISREDGMYTVSTELLGTITVKEAYVARVHSFNGSDTPLAIDYQAFYNQTNSSGANEETPRKKDEDSYRHDEEQYTKQAVTHMQQAEAYKKNLMSNPQNTAAVTGMASDPRMMDLANDPEIQRAAESGDIDALMKNEKFMELVNDPALRKEMDKLKK